MTKMSIKHYQTVIICNILMKYKLRIELLLNTINKKYFFVAFEHCSGTVTPLCSGHHGDRGINSIAGG